MATKSRPIKRQKSNTPDIITHTNSIDLSSDLDFLIGYISTKDVLLFLLVSGRITNSSFSDLYERSKEIGWKQVFIEERNNLKLDEKSKPKRIMFNRLIRACSETDSNFEQQAHILNGEITSQMSDPISPQGDYCIHLVSRNDVYNEVKAWKEMQCTRRLFYKECDRRWSLLTLQRLMTNQFIELVNSLPRNSGFLQSHHKDALVELFEHSLIIVVQPSGTDCVAVTKYEKIGKEFLAKLQVRILCLLDLDRIKQHLTLSNIDVTIYPADLRIDCEGDKQMPLIWKTRTIISSENAGRTFHYAELKETDFLKLTRMNAKGKPLYNNGLCQLEFQTKFHIRTTGMRIEVPIMFNSKLFGLCTHAKYCSKYLAKVFISEVNQMHPNINFDTHIDTLNGYICELHKHISGVEAKAHTRQFIKENLQNVYDSFHQSAVSLTGPVMIFSFDIYEDILNKLFVQIKFLGTYPFLAMMYQDSLFRGICSDRIDTKINENTHERTQMVLRFEVSTKQETIDNPNIIFAVYDGTLSKARITHAYFVDDICKCLYKAAENTECHLEMFDDNKKISFGNFSWYYDNGLSRDNLIQADNETIFQPVNVLLQNAIRNDRERPQMSTEQQDVTHTFNLSGELKGNKNLTSDAIAFLEEQFTKWCRMRNVDGALFEIPMQQTRESSNKNDSSRFNEEILINEIDELFNEK